MTDHYPRPSLLADIPLDHHTVIEASAGTGKTFTIENMVVELLLRKQVSLSEILVLTFTERAAAELRRRIRSKIEEILFDPCRETKCDHQKPAGVWWIDQEARQRLSRALFSFDGASIGTIHGFFGRVLTEQAFDNGQLFEGELEDGRVLFGRAFKTALRRFLARQPGDPADLLALWLEQTGNGVDGLEKILWHCHASRRQILPPFSPEAIRRELDTNPLFKIDLRGAADRFGTALKAAKVHGNTARAMLRRLTILSDLIGDSSRGWRTLLDGGFQESVSFIDEGLKSRDLGDVEANKIVDAIRRLREVLVPLKAAMVQIGLPQVRDSLERHKLVSGDFDYDDLISGVVRTLDGARGEELVRAMRARYRFALIDEFQDTDELQWKFFCRVFVESADRNPAYLIGDPKQAIYGFRGADVITYLRARNYVGRTGSPLVLLSRNFRSTPAMIDAYNHILDQSADLPFFGGREIRYDVPVKPGRDLIAEEADGSAYVPIHLLKIHPKGEKLGIGELRRGLARQIAREVRKVLSEDQGLRFGLKGIVGCIKPGDVFILTAKNKEAIEISQALREADVAFAFYKQDGLFQTNEAREVRELLAAIDAPDDRERRGRAWITPFFAVPLGALPSLSDLAASHPLVKRLIDWKELASRRRFETLFTRILDESGIIRRELFLKDDERALTNFLHLFEILLEDARATGCDLGDLLATLTAYIQETRKPPVEDGNVQRLESDRAAVQIMTIHKSKGLEAAVVFLYGGFTPFSSDGLRQYHQENGQRVLYIGDNETAKSTAEREQKEELERLYYVAMTRAKARLYLPYVAPEHWDKGKWRGGYRRVNERLAEIVNGFPDSGKDDLFKVVSVQDRSIGTEPDGPAQRGRDFASWKPRAALLEVRDDFGELNRIRKRHAGYEVSSYSRMKQASSGALDPLVRDEFRAEPGLVAPTVIASEDELPGGTAAGLMLHEILENVPFDSPSSAQSGSAWCALKEVARVIDTAMARNGIDLAYRGEAEAMVYRALTFEIPAGIDRSIPGLHRCRNYLREMEFLFPFPEDGHPPLSEPQPHKLVIERGFIKGFVDLVVEHEGLVYFADWKSDVLPMYDPETISKHVADRYELQAKLYSLALVKALRIGSEAQYGRSFGGLFYVFLRSLRPGGVGAPGTYFERPSWADILSYEHKLKQIGARSRGERS
jgi:exodeoxyribonuclease V beta subunit